MAYLLIENFSGGVNRSRPRYAGINGTVWSGIDGHLTRGGDFEVRKEFASFASVAGTIGLAKTAGSLYVFGSGASPSMPTGVSYQRLQHPTNSALVLTKVKSWDLFNGKLYVIAEYENGDIRHFYDGAAVSDWGAGGDKPSGYGTIIKTHKRKVYSPIGSILWFSQKDSATVFDTTAAPPGGFQNMQNHSSGSDSVTALTTYQNNLAIFSRRVIQIWDMQDDDALNKPAQTISETGTRATKSVIGFGDIDAFFLSDSGIRSLRARNVNNTAGVNDVGTAIDTLVREWVNSLDDADVENAVAVVEPIDGRFWLAIGTRIFVFTYFPTPKISAWSWYDVGITFTDFVTFNDRVYGRSGDYIYLYGGANNDEYAETCTLALPFLTGSKPGTFKNIRGYDIASTGEWDCRVLVNPRNESEYVDIGLLDGVTWGQDGVGAAVHTTHIAPVMTKTSSGYASVSQIGIYYDGAEEKV